MPLKIPEAIPPKAACGALSHCSSASTAEFMKPSDSSCGVVWALPTTKEPASSTMKVSVIVPPASIARTLGLWPFALTLLSSA